MKRVFCYETLLGEMFFAEQDGLLTDICLNEFEITGQGRMEETPLLRLAFEQVSEYLAGDRKAFDLPMLLHGTDFQKGVWEAIKTIPYGQTRSYKDIAIQVGRPGAARAVGTANRNSRLFLMIPCHRVIHGDGTLGGYGSYGVRMKKWLLDLEREHR